MTGPITAPHRGIGNLLGRMHDQAQRDTLGMPDATRRRCWYGNHSAMISGVLISAGSGRALSARR
jgi:hypothetical protein